MFRRRRSTDDFAEEIQSHLALETDELRGEELAQGTFNFAGTSWRNSFVFDTYQRFDTT